MGRHWSDKIVDDIIGALRVFAVSAFSIYIALLLAKSLYPTFPFDNTSSGIVSVILGIFSVFITYVKEKNKK
ncbi:Uncharacterised protein [Candidatus Tiddalikarchaeum anstoanum]|nr:Uncharacterised protein [Candidatus Tiddalikarchaeum anstoanum]